MSKPIYSIQIAYGSESGNAEALAFQLQQQDFLQHYDLSICTLNDLDTEHLGENSLLIIISSSFGDGEPPANAEDFLDKIETLSQLNIRYAIFALGDVTYPKFCGYGKVIDDVLQQKHAYPLIDRVDADLNYQEIFKQWLPILQQSLITLPEQTVQHQLSVKVYDENTTYTAKVLEVRHLAQSKPEVYHLRLDLQNSGIFYQAGDLLYVQIEQSDQLLDQFVAWFADENAKTMLKHKELRLLTKGVLRDLAKINQHPALKDLVKISNKKQLEHYIYGHDILDVLRDFDPEKKITLNDLQDILANLNARAYSISSCGQKYPNHVDLCVRHVYYHLGERDYQGTASHILAKTQVGDSLSVFAKSNPTFHLPEQINAPIVMIGSGTGIAPYLGFLQNLAHKNAQVASYLFFGERHRDKDFLYQQELQAFIDQGVLTQLFTAFSRDQAEKYYVQDAIAQQGELLWQLIEQGAYFYICGSKSMSKAVDDALIKIAEHIGKQPYVDDFNNIISQLIAEDRLFRDVY